MGQKNGNPPALTYFDNKLHLVVGNRLKKQLLWYYSDDGKDWEEIVLRTTERSDFGYPRLSSVEDKLICMYYWRDENRTNRIESTTWRSEREYRKQQIEKIIQEFSGVTKT